MPVGKPGFEGLGQLPPPGGGGVGPGGGGVGPGGGGGGIGFTVTVVESVAVVPGLIPLQLIV